MTCAVAQQTVVSAAAVQRSLALGDWHIESDGVHRDVLQTRCGADRNHPATLTGGLNNQRMAKRGRDHLHQQGG